MPHSIEIIIAPSGGAGTTDLSIENPTSTTLDVASSTGADATVPAATDTNAGLLSAADYSKLLGIEAGASADLTGSEIKALYEAEADTNAFTDAAVTKLSGIATGATVNSADSFLLDRANHTGAQAISTVTNLQTELNGKQGIDNELTELAALNPTNGQFIVHGASALEARVLAATDIPNLDGAKITTGTIANARLSADVVLDAQISTNTRTAVTFSTGWADLDPSGVVWPNSTVTRLHDNWVKIEFVGINAGGATASGATICTIPAWSRPITSNRFALGQTGSGQLIQMLINPSGNVDVVIVGGGSIGAGIYTIFQGIYRINN